jgi:hypothetical protein
MGTACFKHWAINVYKAQLVKAEEKEKPAIGMCK